MPSFSATLPAIDQNLVGVWTEQDQNQYNKLPYYLEVASAERRKRYSVWPELITDTVKWKPNMANTMRMVITEESPLTRQEARPNSIQVTPMADIANVQERTVDAALDWQRFVSPHMRFLPAFQDFLKGQIVPTRQSVEAQRDWFEECYYRSYIWDYSPRVWVAGYGLVEVPVGRTNGASNKTAGVLSNLVNLLPANGFLTFQHCFDILSEAEATIGMTPFEGSGLPGGEASGLDQRFALVQSHESFRQFVNDPWVKENRVLTTDIVNKPYKGPIHGSIVPRLENKPFRWSTDNDNVVTFPAPETRIGSTAQNEFNRTAPNPAYSKISQAQFEIAWLVGGKSYRRIETGPPPEFFSGGTSDPAKIAGMQWNGQVYATKNFLVPMADAGGNIVWDTNSFGHYMRWQSELALGMIGPNAHNILPILYRRRLGTTNVLPA